MTSRYHRILAGGIVFLAMAVAGMTASGSENQAGLEFFEKKIRPVLVAQCYECHSSESEQVQGGLLLDTRAGIRKGGDSGPAVVPGQGEDSLLLGAIRYADFEMPPKQQLSEDVIADFEKWIAMGAPDPRDGQAKPVRTGIDFDQARQFWSFRPLSRPEVPEVKGRQWPQTEIDRFILDRLEAEGLEPAADADRRTLLRRASFDLIGLPPSPEAIDAFLNDESPDAFARAIDALLTSPHFGERWGRHWLDVTRYADSSGGGRAVLFQNAWRYRDYVIESLNRDKPFDRFVIEQIAGDLLPYETPQQRREQITATGFLMLGPTNYELQDKELLRMEVVDEQLDTMGRAFLGMTIGCARCHDHKFDPIPTRDYYALAGIFRSTKTLTPGNVSGFVKRELPTSPEHRRALEQHKRAVEPIREQFKQAEAHLKSLEKRLTGGSRPFDPANLAGIVVDEPQAQLRGDWSFSDHVQYFVGDGYHHARAKEALVRFEIPLPESGRYQVRLAYNAHGNRATNVPVAVHHAQGVANTTVNQRQPPPIDEVFTSLGVFRFTADKPAVIVVACRGVDGVVIADAVQLLPVAVGQDTAELTTLAEKSDGHTASQRKRLRARIDQAKSQVKQLTAQLKELERNAPPPPPEAMAAIDEKPDEIGDFRICIRGNVHNLGEEVPRGFLTVISGESLLEIPPDESGRRQLAEWLVSQENPLVARVIVNRIWHHLFGVGLVRTVDNFGQMGEPPSHPELLDWLAVRFIEDGWSIKSLIRQIMLSRVYQISSQQSPAARNVDPENRLLSHQNRRRLEAEALRDSILAISGQLDFTAGGPSMRAKTRSEFGYQFDGTRRSVYIPIFRNTLHEIFTVFDFADPNLVMGRRNTSTLPTQALYLMNSPFLMDQARHAAQKLLEEQASLDLPERIELAYRQTLGRPPASAERDHMLQYLGQFEIEVENSETAERRLEAWAGLYQALFGCIDFRYVN